MEVNMLKKVSICVVSLVAVAAFVVLEIYGYFDTFENKLDGEFSVDDPSMFYQDAALFKRMANPKYYEDIYFGKVDNIAKLKKQAQKVWIKKYGLRVRYEQKPYMVYYDPSYDIYYIFGTTKAAFGGTAHIFVRGEDGLVISIWHYK